MTTSSSKKDLPPNWIVKTSRQYPSLSYYANVKTGQSSWKHPSLLKESELKTLTKKKSKKKLRENDAELKKDMGVKEQQSESPRKTGKFAPISCSPAAASTGNNQELNGDTGDQKDLETKQLSNDNTGNEKSKPIRFSIKKKNVLSAFPNTESSSKKSVTLHPSILLAQKIANRDLHLHVKRKGKDDKHNKETTHDAVEGAKKMKTNQEILKLPAATTKTDPLPASKTGLINKEHRAEDSKIDISKGGKKAVKEKGKHKRHRKTVESVPATELAGHHGDKEGTEREQEEDEENIKAKEDQLYRDFIERRSNLWKKNRYGTQKDNSKKTLRPELYKDEHSEELPEKVRLDQPEEEASLSSKEVPYVDHLEISKPVPVPTEDNTIYPEVIDMEIDEEELNTEIANFRGSASYSRLAISEGFSDSSTCHSSASLYFVVDTNVLIRDIDCLQMLKSSLVDGRESVVVVPYVALQEMDGLKKSTSIGHACQAAVRWCNQHFEARHPRVQGQTYANYRTTVEENKGASADDLVRDCSLLLAREGLDVCLVTNDVNLRNKALMSNLSAISAKDLKKKLAKLSDRQVYPSPRPPQVVSKCEESQMNDVNLNEFNSGVDNAYEQKSSCHQTTSSTVVPKQQEHRSEQKASRLSCSMTCEDMMLLERITTSLHHTLSNILQDVMQEIYEDLWLTVIKHKPPWSLTELFACWEKHWIAAMTDKFPSNMKELLAETKNLLTASHVDVQKLSRRVQELFSYFRSKPYRKYILPAEDPSSVVVDMSEAPISTPTCSSTAPAIDSSSVPHESSNMTGVINVEKMINQVGAHITHFVSLVLTAFGVQHSLQTLSSMSVCESLTPDNARTSGINLHKVIMSLGTAITRCLNEKTSSALQELGHLLVNFWSEAHLPCPHLPFMECDLRHFVESLNSAQYLKCVLQELESLVQQLISVLGSI